MRLCNRFFLAVFALIVSSVAVAYTDGIHNPSANSVGNFEGIDSNASSGVAAPFGITFVGSNNNVIAASSFTFTAQGIGTADATRIVVVGIAHAINTVTVSSVTIGGVSATQAASAAGNSTLGVFSDIWYLAVSAGTAADIVVNFSGSQTRVAIDVYRVVGTGSAFSAANTAFTASSLTLTASVTVPAGGGAIAILNVHSSAAAATVTNGGNLTIDQNGTAYGNSIIGAGKNTSASGSTSFTFNWTTSVDAVMSVIAFTP